jgi:HEXXH motif-containing protein
MLFDRFASPREGAFIDLAEVLASRHFGSVMKKVNEIGNALGASNIQLPSENHQRSLNYWRPEVGVVKLALTRGYTTGQDWHWLSLQAELAAYLSNAIDAVQREVVVNRPLVVAGHLVPAGDVKVGTRDGVLFLESSALTRPIKLEMVAVPGQAPAWRCDSRALPISFGTAATVITTYAEWMSVWSSEDKAEHTILQDSDGFVDQVTRASELLEKYCPEYYLWTAALLKEVAPLDRPGALGAGTSSQSFLLWPAQVHMSRASALQTIVMLVHECSHQYFHMLMWGAPVIKDGAQPVFSVLKNCQRPLDRVLLGFHAFGNVLLALNSLKGCGDIDQHELASEIAHTIRLVEGLGASLEQGLANLEVAGEEIYLPLRKRLVAQGRLGDAVAA